MEMDGERSAGGRGREYICHCNPRVSTRFLQYMHVHIYIRIISVMVLMDLAYSVSERRHE